MAYVLGLVAIDKGFIFKTSDPHKLHSKKYKYYILLSYQKLFFSQFSDFRCRYQNRVSSINICALSRSIRFTANVVFASIPCGEITSPNDSSFVSFNYCIIN